MPSALPRAASLWLALLLAQAAGCGRDNAKARADQARIRARLEADIAVSEVMKRADDLVVSRKGKEALALLEQDALPRAKRNAEDARADRAQSPWGESRSREAQALLDDRKLAVEDYLGALRADDPEKVVSLLEARQSLERRGLTLSDSLKTLPEPQGGC